MSGRHAAAKEGRRAPVAEFTQPASAEDPGWAADLKARQSWAGPPPEPPGAVQPGTVPDPPVPARVRDDLAEVPPAGTGARSDWTDSLPGPEDWQKAKGPLAVPQNAGDRVHHWFLRGVRPGCRWTEVDRDRWLAMERAEGFTSQHPGEPATASWSGATYEGRHTVHAPGCLQPLDLGHATCPVDGDAEPATDPGIGYGPCEPSAEWLDAVAIDREIGAFLALADKALSVAAAERAIRDEEDIRNRGLASLLEFAARVPAEGDQK